jgi:hypothetical protein
MARNRKPKEMAWQNEPAAPTMANTDCNCTMEFPPEAYFWEAQE